MRQWMFALTSGLVTLGMATAGSAQQSNFPETAVNRITEAAPAKATAKPLQKRKLLVFNLCRGFKHGAIPYGAKAMEILGQKTGAFETVVTEDIGMFEQDKLNAFDAVCMNNTTGEVFLPADMDKLPQDQQAAARETEARLKKNLLDFVSGGKGLVGIHAATDCYYNWPEYGDMIGAYFDGHPWSEEVGVKIDDPSHPLCAAFKGQGFMVRDEIYQFREPYSREKLRLLLSIDNSKTNMQKDGIKRQDKDFAVAWVRSYNKGRVFYCSLGHNNEIFWTPAILQHYLDGVQFAMGDLQADTTPSVSSGQTTAEDWKILFDGTTLDGWAYREGAWVVEDGAMALKGKGYIWTKEKYQDFILELEYKISPGGNSGVFFRTANLLDVVQAGIEMQVYDSHGKAEVTKHDTGAIYDCLAPSKNAAKPNSEWNKVVITCQANKITIVMNDEPIIDMDLNQWTEPNKNADGTPNKFKTAYKDMVREGYIGFQEHGNPVWYRNVRIKTL